MNVQSDLKKILNGSRKAAASVTDGLKELRLRRLRLLDEREEIADRPTPKDEALAALDHDLDELVGIAKRETNVRSLTRADKPSWSIPQNGILLGLLIGANREAFRDLLAAMIGAVYESGPDPISDEEREAALRRLDEEILELEVAEESAIRSAEASGLSVLRRADADPRAALISDESLK